MDTFIKFKDVQWEVFSKYNKRACTIKNVSIRPVDNEAFIQSMASCTGILCGAGFETPAEALFLNKKLMVLPMKNQYEQHCNAAALEAIGVPALKNLKGKHTPLIENWIQNGTVVNVNFPDITESIIDLLIENQVSSKFPSLDHSWQSEYKLNPA